MVVGTDSPGASATSGARRSFAADLGAALYFEWQSRIRSWRLSLQWAIGPALTLVFFAPAMANAMRTVTWGGGTTGYAAYFLPGLLAMNAFVAGTSAGVPVWLDRMTGELEVHFGLPVRRGALLLARVAGSAASAVVQGLVVFLGSLFLFAPGVPHDPWRWAGAIGAAAFLAAAVGFVYLAICCLIQDQDSFNLFLNLLNTPLILTSSIYYPVEAMPTWLRPVALANPLSHGAAICRAVAGVVPGPPATVATPAASGLAASAVFLGVFALVAFAGAVWAFRRAVR